MRIKVIQLGYSFQEDLASKIGAKRARLYGSIQNPFTFTSYSELIQKLEMMVGVTLHQE